VVVVSPYRWEVPDDDDDRGGCGGGCWLPLSLLAWALLLAVGWLFHWLAEVLGQFWPLPW
jgi:hypothetical protein